LIQADRLQISTNQLAINFLEFGAANRVSDPKPSIVLYVTDDPEKRCLLTDSGRSGLDAIKNIGDGLEENQIQKDAVRWLRLLDERSTASGQ
jgi:hypothetical protein